MTPILTTMVVINDGPDGPGSIYKIDTIKHDGGVWLVPSWHEHVGKGYMTPERIVRLDTLPHQALGQGSKIGHYNLNDPIPYACLFGPLPSEGYDYPQVLSSPDIRIPTGAAQPFHLSS